MYLPSFSELLRGVRRELVNWPAVTLLGSVLSPNRYFPLSERLCTTRLARRVTVLKLRSGGSLLCRYNEFPPFFEVFALGQYDVPEVDWARVRTVVDVGANIGMATVWFAKRAPQARIIAVEPSTDALTLLYENVARNGLADRVVVVPAALGGTVGVATLSASPASVFSRLLESEDNAGPPSAVGQTVPMTTLEELAVQFGLESIDVLKLDCEGAEYNVLDSVPPHLMARIGQIVGEYHTWSAHSPPQLRALLETRGLQVEMTAGEGPIGLFRASRAI